MSESSFVDGGHDHGHMHDHGHDHGHSQHGHGHGHHGHGHSHNFISHLLGLDHDAHHGEGHGEGHGHDHQGGEAPSQSPIWTSALQGVRITDALRGIRVTPNFLFLMLFVGFFLWLFVVYWIRHHEPLANQVLGDDSPRTPTAHADRQLVNGVKEAFPVRTSVHTGTIYVPNVPPVEPAAIPQPQHFQPLNQQASSPPPYVGIAQPMPYQQPVYAPGMASTANGLPGHPALLSPGQAFPGHPGLLSPGHSMPGHAGLLSNPQDYSQANAYSSAYGQPQMMGVQPGPGQSLSGPSAMYMPVHHGGGTRVRMVVNR